MIVANPASRLVDGGGRTIASHDTAQLDRPREFSEHLAARGVPNSTGSFHLIPLDQRLPFSGDTPPTGATAAELLDGILAIVLTRGDDDEQIRSYADTITREATRWASA